MDNRIFNVRTFLCVYVNTGNIYLRLGAVEMFIISSMRGGVAVGVGIWSEKTITQRFTKIASSWKHFSLSKKGPNQRKKHSKTICERVLPSRKRLVHSTHCPMPACSTPERPRREYHAQTFLAVHISFLLGKQLKARVYQFHNVCGTLSRTSQSL